MNSNKKEYNDMRNFIPYVSMALSAIIYMSCDKNTPGSGSDPDRADAIHISTSIGAAASEAELKSPDLDDSGRGNFTSGDVFTIFVSKPGFKTVATDFKVGTTTMTWSGLGYPESANPVFFSACYPPQAAGDDGTFIFNTANTEEKDLLLSAAKEVEMYTPETIDLSFRHAMHQLKIEFTSDDFTDGELNAMRFECEARSECTVNALTGEVESAGEKKDVTPITGKQASVIIVPQKTMDVTITASIPGQEPYSVRLDSLLSSSGKPVENLESGKTLSISLNIDKEKHEIILIESSTIEGWESQGSISGDITLPAA